MKISRTLKIASLTLGVGFLLGMGLIGVIGLRDQISTADLVVVPGNTVNRDGAPSDRLKGRLDAAVDVYRAGACKAVLVSGGIGKEGFDEAKVMKTYLVSKGVPEASVFADSNGVNTFETARYTRVLLREKGFNSVILASQYFHIARFKMAMSKNGVSVVGHVHSRYFEPRDCYALCREVVGYVAYALKATQAG